MVCRLLFLCIMRKNQYSITIDNIKKVMSHADVVYEIIVVNDGSTDATSEKLEKFDIIKVEHRLNKRIRSIIKIRDKKINI